MLFFMPYYDCGTVDEICGYAIKLFLSIKRFSNICCIRHGNEGNKLFIRDIKNADGHCYDSSSVKSKICDLANKWLPHEINLQGWTNEQNWPPNF